MVQGTERLFLPARLEPVLKMPDVENEAREPPWYGYGPALRGDRLVRRHGCGFPGLHACAPGRRDFIDTGAIVLPEEDGQQETRRYRFVFGDTEIGIVHGEPNQRAVRGDGGKQYAAYRRCPDDAPGVRCMAGEEQLGELLEEAGGRDRSESLGRQVLVARNAGIEIEAELGLKAQGAKQPYGVFPETFPRIADATQAVPFDVLDAADEIEDFIVMRVVVQGVDRKVAPERVFVEPAVGVVAQDQAGGMGGAIALFVGGQQLAERGHFHEFPPVVHMRDLEPAPDHARAPKQPAHLLRRGVSGDIEVFRGGPQQQVPYAATDQQGLKPCFPEPADDIQRVRVDTVPGHVERPGVQLRCGGGLRVQLSALNQLDRALVLYISWTGH